MGKSHRLGAEFLNYDVVLVPLTKLKLTLGMRNRLRKRNLAAAEEQSTTENGKSQARVVLTRRTDGCYDIVLGREFVFAAHDANLGVIEANLIAPSEASKTRFWQIRDEQRRSVDSDWSRRRRASRELKRRMVAGL